MYFHLYFNYKKKEKSQVLFFEIFQVVVNFISFIIHLMYYCHIVIFQLFENNFFALMITSKMLFVQKISATITPSFWLVLAAIQAYARGSPSHLLVFDLGE